MRSIQFLLVTASIVIFSFPSFSQEDDLNGFYYEPDSYSTPAQQYLYDQTYGSLPASSPATFDWGGTNPPPTQPSVPLEDGMAILIASLLIYRAIKLYTNNPINDAI